MWELYQALRNGLKTQENLLIDEMSKILEGITSREYKKALDILYPKMQKTILPVDSLILFIDGLQYNRFFDFCSVIGEINGRS
jgi:hypothetical protein